jgi:UDPglucose 6-dehydrogenase
MNKQCVGLVGHGFVGEAFEVGMRHAFDILVHDTFKYGDKKSILGKEGEVELEPDMKKFVERANIIFVCVPTPMRPDGSCDTSIVTSVVEKINSYNNENIVVIKSTVTPGTTEMLHNKCIGLSGVVFNPEFLTEVNHIKDFKNQNRIIVGCSNDALLKVASLYDIAYPNVPIIKTRSTIAEMVKYTTNCFLATKLSFANEIFQICDALNIDYDDMIRFAQYDERLGKSFWSVPGHDGSYGFGKSCFPKDINGLISLAKSLGIDPKVLSAAWAKNLEVRPPAERDWERMSKAVTNVKVGE